MRRAYVTLALVCSGWGTIPLVVRRVPLPATAIVGVRLWVAALGLGAALLATRRAAPPRPALLSVHRGLCLAAGLVLAIHWIALFSAYKRAPAGTVILIVYLAPIGIAGLAPATLGERVGTRTLWALDTADKCVRLILTEFHTERAREQVVRKAKSLIGSIERAREEISGYGSRVAG